MARLYVQNLYRAEQILSGLGRLSGLKRLSSHAQPRLLSARPASTCAVCAPPAGLEQGLGAAEGPGQVPAHARRDAREEERAGWDDAHRAALQPGRHAILPGTPAG